MDADHPGGGAAFGRNFSASSSYPVYFYQEASKIREVFKKAGFFGMIDKSKQQWHSDC